MDLGGPFFVEKFFDATISTKRGSFTFPSQFNLNVCFVLGRGWYFPNAVAGTVAVHGHEHFCTRKYFATNSRNGWSKASQQTQDSQFVCSRFNTSQVNDKLCEVDWVPTSNVGHCPFSVPSFQFGQQELHSFRQYTRTTFCSTVHVKTFCCSKLVVQRSKLKRQRQLLTQLLFKTIDLIFSFFFSNVHMQIMTGNGQIMGTRIFSWHSVTTDTQSAVSAPINVMG
jgi:hypothetical protein